MNQTAAEKREYVRRQFVETAEWSLEDPKGKRLENAREIQDEMSSRVIDLLTEWEING